MKAAEDVCCIFAFDASNRLAVRASGSRSEVAFAGADLAGAQARLEAVFPTHSPPAEYFFADVDGRRHRVFFSQIGTAGSEGKQSLSSSSVALKPIAELEKSPLSPVLAALLARLEPYLPEIPYLHLDEGDFIYKFRPERERNSGIYARQELYESHLFAAIKARARRFERTSADPVELDFGAIRYVIPSHFGFCLGVKNAIERAYETLAANPGRRVFMLSELIHNPFVNDDLLRRGLRYLQTDRGVPCADGERLWWDELTPEDVVVIPAFGATDDDKRRLVRKGIAIAPYDATCMLVEKVWKAARVYGRQGYTVIIHGKREHEETKATFSNARRHAPTIIVRDLEEARRLGEIIGATDPAERARFYAVFAGRHTPGFDVDRDLERVAVVNQTTLLVNETRRIISYLQDAYAARYGPDRPGELPRVGGSGRNDTLCYATQVNQDALARALEGPLDAAFVVGGRNSSNTQQLYRLCAERLGNRAFFIQSEADIRSRSEVEHSIFGTGGGGRTERRPLWGPESDAAPKRVLITGGASCPDGIIQQVVLRLNSLVPPELLRSPEAVLADLGPAEH